MAERNVTVSLSFIHVSRQYLFCLCARKKYIWTENKLFVQSISQINRKVSPYFPPQFDYMCQCSVHPSQQNVHSIICTIYWDATPKTFFFPSPTKFFKIFISLNNHFSEQCIRMIQQLRYPFLRHFSLGTPPFPLHNFLADQWVVLQRLCNSWTSKWQKF